MLRKRIFQAKNLKSEEPSNEFLIKLILFEKCRKYSRSFPQILRKLSSVPQDLKITKDVFLEA